MNEKQFYEVTCIKSYFNKISNTVRIGDVKEIVLASSADKALEHVKSFYTDVFTETDTSRWSFDGWDVHEMHYMTAE